MDELGFNKIAAAVLATALGVMLLREAPHFFMHSNAPEVPVYSVGPLEVAATNDAELDLPFPQADWVAAMDAERGAKVFKKCKSCHNVEAGGANGTGPGLYGVVGNTSGTHAGFSYSTAMSSAGYAWDYEALDGFLEKPAKYLKGTKMSFAGLKKPADRAAVIEYLRVNAPSPVARPSAAAGPVDEAVMEADAAVIDETGQAVETVITNPEGEAAETMVDKVEGAVEEIKTDATETMKDMKDAVEE